MDVISMIKNYVTKGLSPKNIVLQITQDNPVINNLLKMIDEGNDTQVENFARNIMKEKGRDFDKEFSDFMSNFK